MHTPMISTLRGRALLALAVFGIGLPRAATAAMPFASEIVGTIPTFGSGCSIALDSGDQPYISFGDAQLSLLHFAAKRDGRWNDEIVESGGGNTYLTSIAVTAYGDPRIAYSRNAELWFANRSSGVWTLEFVRTGISPSLALDVDGNPHIAYYDAVNQDLVYSKKSGGVWTHELVDTAGDVGLNPSLALDSQGDPHISYRNATQTQLKYAHKSSGVWTIELPQSGGDRGLRSSIALDETNTPHIAYVLTSSSFGLVMYTTKINGVWSSYSFDTIPGTASLNNITLHLDSRERPMIAYGVPGGDGMSLASLRGGVWEIEEFPDLPAVELGMALDSHDRPRVACRNVGNQHLLYADASAILLSPRGGEQWAAGSQQSVRWTGVGGVSIALSADGGGTYQTLVPYAEGEIATIQVPEWTTPNARVRVTRLDDPTDFSDSPNVFAIAPSVASPWWSKRIATTNNVGEFCSLALDADGAPRASYYDNTNGDLVYTEKLGGVWAAAVVDATGNVGQYTSLAIDAFGDPSVGYFDVTNGDLKYAKRTNGTWARETVDATGTVGLYCSLALDASGTPHVSYWDSSNSNLKYARKVSGVWVGETVDSPGTVGEYSSLVLDREGNPHIAYRDGTNGAVKYARKVSGAWIVETAEALGESGFFVSLALDPYGNPGICHWEATRFDLFFTRKEGGVWSTTTVDAAGDVGWFSSIEFDADGIAWVSYYDNTNDDLKLAREVGDGFRVETLATDGDVGWHPSLALDAEGNARVTYYDNTNDDLVYVSSAIELNEPSPDLIWPVGAVRTVSWDGVGDVDLYLSVDGGTSWELQAARLNDGSYSLRVPHAPSRFARLKLERAVPRSISRTPGLVSIETAIELLGFGATEPQSSRGVSLSWNTNPGPDDLAGYRIERSREDGGWVTVLEQTRETTYHDLDGGPGARYRLFAVNGLGNEVLLGVTNIPPARALSAWPLPYRGGSMNVNFAVASGLGGGRGQADVSIVDAQGRRLRTLARGDFAPGFHRVAWDGEDRNGRPLPSGVYYLRLHSAGETHDVKIVSVR